ncbi:inositol monophosphatase family protein [filamentous cyanobacterium LEGE 11480]|uniref:Inositol monophosphatase family protein n=1 Tax=Romeriopsis navalis LEGE 11480 TaxID=2777977 RepID=A0A928VQE2_9CYAN|nr:inositol monophosphatase family protein [Romeriopsis navalis]MBE9031883.1 inositol monophosphatase family protein [Romeriopsis navalis LEGE 11480]
MVDFWDEVLGFCHVITAEVGDYLIAKLGTVAGEEKSDGSLVTECDQWSDDRIRDAIRQQFPSHGVLSEETEHLFPDNDWCWIIDPIDGTTNFTRGLPLWGISLGLLYKGVPVFGYVLIPMIKQSFYGYWTGDSGLDMPTGAYCNGNAIRVSTDATSGNHFFNLCARSIQVLQTPVPAKIRMLGVATYNVLTVAMGAALGGVEATPKIWDIAAVWAIVQAAGATWKPLETQPIFPLQVGRDYGGRSFPTLVVARPDLLPVFEPLVQCIVR